MTTLSRFDIEGTLGKGAFGEVMKVRSKRSGKQYAMKKVDGVKNTTDAKKEADIHMEVRSNMHVVSLYSYFFTRDTMYLVMDYCNGGTLTNYVLKNEMTKTRMFRFMREMIKGVKYLHSKNIVHRDIKPDNILIKIIDFKPTLKLADFGLARYHDGFNDASTFGSYYYMHSGCGTMNFIAPEVLQGHYTSKCDVFSLGVVFYAIISRETNVSGRFLTPTVDGRTFFYQARNSAIRARIRERVTGDYKQYASLIQHMLVKDYRKRPTVEELDPAPAIQAQHA